MGSAFLTYESSFLPYLPIFCLLLEQFNVLLQIGLVGQSQSLVLVDAIFGTSDEFECFLEVLHFKVGYTQVHLA